MDKLEKVIKGLESCLSPGHDCPLDCPYCGNCRGDELYRDALELLKAQQPRVMTLDEVKASKDHDVWLELSGNIAEDVMTATTITGCGTKGISTRYEALNYDMYEVRPYGWRCWTARPTDEQREVTPWE